MKPEKGWFKQFLSRDRRRADRHVAPPLVAYYWNGGVPEAHRVLNISSTGLYLSTEERWYAGTLVMLRLQRTDDKYAGDDRSIAVQSMVVRWDAGGVGLEFVFPENQDSRQRQRLLDAADRKTFANFVGRLQERADQPLVDSTLTLPLPAFPDRSWGAIRSPANLSAFGT